MSDQQWIFAGFVGLALILLGSYFIANRDRLSGPPGTVPLPEPRPEPDHMTEGKRLQIGGVTVTTGDTLERRIDGGVPYAKRARVCAFSGELILRSSAEVKALSTGLAEIAKDLDE